MIPTWKRFPWRHCVRPMLRVVLSLALVGAAPSCDSGGVKGSGGAGGDVANTGGSSSAGNASTAGRSGSGGGNPFVPKQTCGGVTCETGASCCTEDDACGSKYGGQIFVTHCVDLEARGGALSSECADSPEYCKGERCQEFPGCVDASSNCGFWVEGFDFIAGEEVIHFAAHLQCVPKEEFIEP